MTAELEFFSSDDAVATLEAALVTAQASGDEAEQVSALIAVAWQLRQRDTKRALALADDAKCRLASADLPENEKQRSAARLQLIRGEAHWLKSELESSEALAASAQEGFAALGDATGSADAHWLYSWLAQDQGDGARRSAELEAMVAAATHVDSVRVTAAQAALARSEAFHDVISAQTQWGAHLAGDSKRRHPAATCWVEDFLAVVALLRSDHVEAIRHGIHAYTSALDSGQQRRAIIIATNIGVNFSNLNDYAAAIEWMQRGLDLARASGWPGMIGLALTQTADSLRLLQRLDAAAELLREALALMAPLAASRNYAIALRYLGDVELDDQRVASSLDNFRLLEQRATALDATDLLSDALRGQAKALLELGQPEQAAHAAQAAFEGTGADPGRRIGVLQILAEIHACHPLAPPADLRAASVPLHYLQQALDLAATIENYSIPGELLEAIAKEHARLSDYQQAFAFGQQAIKAREKIQSTEASNRAIALEIRHETERARAEADYNKQLAQSEARRAELLQGAIATLENLGEIGRDITANLDMASVFDSLDRHVHRLLDATTFAIYLHEHTGHALQSVLIVEAGRHLPPHRIKMDDRNSYLARCARDRAEIVLELERDAAVAGPSLIPGTLPTLSLMYAPLMAGDRLLGVMTIQSPQANAYGERETAIFRTLCAYGAVALANGHAYDTAENARRSAELARADTARALEELGRAQLQLEEKNRELELLSTTDRLTGLSNRLRLEVALTQELARSDRHQRAFSLILLDIDNFKSVNDTHGHHVGDAVLVEVAKVLGNNIRKTDLAGRWGGEEFLIICLDTGAEAAAQLAEKIRAALAAHDIAVAGPRTASLGVCSYRAADDFKSMMMRADAALYRVKQSGRNRVESG